MGDRMDFKVIWSDAAIADLHDLCSYIAQHHAIDSCR